MAKELDLHAIPRDELLPVICDALYEGDENTIAGAIEVALERGIAARNLVSDGLVAGANRVGFSFGMNGEMPAVAALQAGIAALRPHVIDMDGRESGTMVIGTVKGNGHDTGKDLVALMMKSAGFTVYDIGVNNALEDYLNAVETYTPDILGLCALQSWTVPYTRVVTEALCQEGRRDDLIVVVSGAPLQGKSTEQLGADAYCCSPADIVEVAQQLMARRP